MENRLTNEKGLTQTKGNETENSKEKKEVCWFAIRNKCTRNPCRYVHAEPRPIPEKNTKLHEKQREEMTEMKPTRNKDNKQNTGNRDKEMKRKEPCHFYKKGICNKGSRCSFGHEKSQENGSKNERQGMQTQVHSLNVEIRRMMQKVKKIETEMKEREE